MFPVLRTPPSGPEVQYPLAESGKSLVVQPDGKVTPGFAQSDLESRALRAIDGSTNDLPSIGTALSSATADGYAVRLMKGAEFRLEVTAPTVGNLPSYSRLLSQRMTRIRASGTNTAFFFALYGTATGTLASNTLASAPSIDAPGSNVFVAGAWIGTPPAVGQEVWVQQALSPACGGQYDVVAIGQGAIGSTDVTAAALYGPGGALNGKTLTLDVDGAGETSLVFAGGTTSANLASALIAMRVTWPALFQAGTASTKLVLAASTIVIGAGNANAALGLIAGAAANTSLVVERPIVWPYIAGDLVTLVVGAKRDIELDFSGAIVEGGVNQLVEFAHTNGAIIRNLKMKATSALGSMAAFDVGCRNCLAENLANECDNGQASIGIYVQSNERTTLRDGKFIGQSSIAVHVYDSYATEDVNNWTANCSFAGHAFVAIDPGVGFGCIDCKTIGGGDIGSNLGLWLRDAKNHAIVGFSSRRNSNAGIIVDSGCVGIKLVDCNLNHATIGLQIQVGAQSVDVNGLNTDGCITGITSSVDTRVTNWRHRSDLKNPGGVGIFNSTVGPVLLAGLDIQTPNAVTGVSLAIGGTSDVHVIEANLVTGGASTCIQQTGNCRTILKGVKCTGGVGINVVAGTVVVGEGCSLAGAGTPFVLAGGTLEIDQTEGLLVFTTGNRFLLIDEIINNTSVNVTNASAATVMGIPGVVGVGLWVINTRAVGSIQVISTAAADPGVVIAATKAAMVMVNQTLNCVRLSADT